MRGIVFALCLLISNTSCYVGGGGVLNLDAGDSGDAGGTGDSSVAQAPDAGSADGGY